MNKNEKTMYVVSHSHWDREWYLSHAKHNFNLVQFMDKLIEVLETDAEFKTFHLDGQIIILQDYLNVRPSMTERVKALIAAGKLKIGPFYVLQDEYLISGEANVRNALVGLKETERYGAPTMVGYFPDTFGNVGQMPQILRGFGIDCAFVGRGTVPIGYEGEALGKTDEGSAQFIWMSPDGSEVVTTQFTHWYSSGMELETEEQALDGRLNALLNAMGACTKTPYILLMNGCDHQPVQADLSTAFALAKKLGYDVRHTSCEEFASLLTAYRDSFPVWQGEIRAENGCGVRTLRETASARIYLKQASQKAGRFIEGIAEPLSVVANEYGLQYDQEMLHYIWKGLLENYPHDSICGCSVDEVHTKMEIRFADTMDTTQSLIDQIGRRLVAKVCGEEKSILVVNGSAKSVYGYVECVVDYRDGEVVPVSPALIDEQGNEYALDVEDLGKMTVYELPEDKFRNIYDVRRFVYRVYGKFSPAACTLLKIVEGKPTASGVAYGDGWMENAIVKVTFNRNGTFNVEDKATGRVLRDQNAFFEVGDEGNEYEFFPSGETFNTLQNEATVSVMNVKSQSVTFLVVNELMQQNGETVRIESRVTLYANERGVKVAVRFENACKDHRIRADFAWEDTGDRHNSAGHFDIVNRNNYPLPRWTSPTHSQRTYEFVERISNSGDGMILAVRGNNEYEIVEGTGHTQLTLVRGIGILGDWFPFPTEDSQCLREVTAEYEVQFYVSGGRTEAVENAYAFHKPCLYAFAGNGKGEGVKPSVIGIEGNVIVSCLKQSDCGETVLRVFNPYEETQEIVFDRSVCVTNLRETENGERVRRLQVPPKKIITVKM